jgi:hypothetical protein
MFGVFGKTNDFIKNEILISETKKKIKNLFPEYKINLELFEKKELQKMPYIIPTPEPLETLTVIDNIKDIKDSIADPIKELLD